MPNKPFYFKQFKIEQDRCAMKIGTDGVLLGAWAPIKNTESILDIGTGTGIIALMMAQRSEAMLIDALEIDEDAYEQSVDNFENSDWGDRLFCYHAEFDEFVEEMKDEEKYDLIISNPPFYGPEFKTTSEARDKARFQDALPFDLLLGGSSKLLADRGTLSIIIPSDAEASLLKIAENFKLHPSKITYVKGNSKSKVKRCLINFKFKVDSLEKDELIIETERHLYTEDYKNLVKDFYLKM
ncbi:tRNA1(Val) (adenine(37)-N6)-methyltransferase [Zunongwangia sp.]|uniref:tRNA1(Val) (adenine(37)-N6)-methyltransferase n=1 Tax=Zunongwangia sp. TaxID=1965325 RepID=UPI003AA9519E